MNHLSLIIKKLVVPTYTNNSNCFVFASNNNYAPYLGVALFSFIQHIPNDEVCDIFILHTELSPSYQQKIQALERKNISIRFLSVAPFLEEFDQNIFKIHAHFSKEAYYRFFIPQIFVNYEKVVYLDCDMLFLCNMNEILHIDLQNKAMAAVLEYKFKCKVEFDATLHKYAKEILKLNNVQKYFNSGVLIFDIAKLRSMNFTQKCLEKLVEIVRPRTVDQCVINSILHEKVLLLNPSWNMQTHVDVEELKNFAPAKDYEDYMQSFTKPRVIHYCSPLKPWNTTQIPFGDLWWDCAEKTEFYQDIKPE